jgi:hypothetical protein
LSYFTSLEFQKPDWANSADALSLAIHHGQMNLDG